MHRANKEAQRLEELGGKMLYWKNGRISPTGGWWKKADLSGREADGATSRKG